MQVKVRYNRIGGTSTAYLNNVTKEAFETAITDSTVTNLFTVCNNDDELLVIPMGTVLTINLTQKNDEPEEPLFS